MLRRSDKHRQQRAARAAARAARASRSEAFSPTPSDDANLSQPLPHSSTAPPPNATTPLRSFDRRHIDARCLYHVPDIAGNGELGRRYPDIVRRVNKDCAGLRVTRYSMYWNLAFWLLREASEGRTFGGDVLEISGHSFLRPYLQRPGTRFTQADYPAVDVLSLDVRRAASLTRAGGRSPTRALGRGRQTTRQTALTL